MLWHIELKFCIWLCFTVLQIKFECRQFASIFVGVMPLLELKLLEIQFSALFSYMLWHIELKFCIWLCFTVLQIKFECRQFPSIFVGVMPLLELKLLEIQFSALSPTCFDILSWNFAHDFVLMYYRSSLSVVNLRQFLWELCPFWNLNYALTYWVEILHMTLFYCTTDQVRVSSIFVGVMPLLELRILKIYCFPHFFLTCFDLLSWKFAHGFVVLK